MTEEKEKILIIKQLIEGAKDSLNTAFNMLAQITGTDNLIQQKASEIKHSETAHEGERIVEGLFDGQHMVDSDGKVYTVPANYASKSKLIEGDKMKLTITNDGKFMYKQIGPKSRKRIVGQIFKDAETQELRVLADGNTYHVLIASVTYFKGEEGDEIIILIPQEGVSKWAAVENVIKKSEQNNVSTEANNVSPEINTISSETNNPSNEITNQNTTPINNTEIQPTI